MIQNKNGVKGLLIGFLVGGTVGAIAALLTTPRSGKELRRNIKTKSKEYLDEADNYFKETKNKATQMFDEVKRKYALVINDIKSKPTEIINNSEQIFNDAKVKIKGTLQTSIDKSVTEAEGLKSSIEAGVQSYKKNDTNSNPSK